MLETGTAETDVPRSLDNVLGYVGVDVSGGRQRERVLFGCLDTDARGTNLPSSSTSAGAVPAFLASSNSFFFRQSSLDSFWAATADMVTYWPS